MRVSMRFKFAFSAAVLAALGCIGVSVFAFDLARTEVLILLRERVAAEVRDFSQRLTALIDAAATEARIYSAAPSLHRYLLALERSGNGVAQARSDVEHLLVATMAQRPVYMRMRVLDDTGRVRLRVARSGGDVAAEAVAVSADRADRDHVRAALDLAPGAVFVSRLEPASANGLSQGPVQSVIRVSAPIDVEGSRLGLVTIDLDGGLLEDIMPVSRHHHVLIDERGNLLMHSDPALRFGLELDTGVTLATQAPAIAAMFTAREHGVQQWAAGLTTAEPVVLAFQRIRYAPGDPARYWVAVSEVPEAQGLEPLSRLAFKLLWVGVVITVLAAVAGGLFGTWLSRPLTRLTQAAEKLSVAKFDSRADLHRQDEIGVLGQAFDHMADQLQMLLRAEVKARHELAATAAELGRSNTDLEQFAYVASHDLKAPLRGIDHLASWLEEDLEPHLGPESRAHLKTLRGRVQRLESLLDGILSFSRAGRKMRDDIAVDTHALARDAVDLSDAAVNFEVTVGPGLPVVMGDPAALQQVFVNLIGNAMKHHDRNGGRIHISAHEEPECYVFLVADDGPGIDPIYRERVFRMFQTLRPRDDVEGSGIGLAVVRRVIERAGGHVTILSGEEGRGCIVRFTWPKPVEPQ